VIDRIKSGTKPSEIFREILSNEPEFNNFDLARIFIREFPRFSTEAVQAIWYWKSGRRLDGGALDDDELDAIVILNLQETGYLSKDEN
jgi:hypothetical protein